MYEKSTIGRWPDIARNFKDMLANVATEHFWQIIHYMYQKGHYMNIEAYNIGFN